MNKRKPRIRIWAALAVALALIGYILLSNRGLPSVKPPAYTPSAPLSAAEAITHNLSVKTSSKLPGMEAMMENDSLLFFMNKETAEFALLDKKNGHVWFSNPQDRSQDPIASGLNKGKLSSQLSLVYLVQNGQPKEFDSYDDSVQYKQFEITQTDGTVIVTYHFGNPERGLEVIPTKISEKRLQEKVYPKLNEDERDEVHSRFKLNEETRIYERRDVPKSAVKRLLALFDKAGYTEQDLAEDNKANGVTDVESGNAKFTVPLEYSLDGGNLVVSVDTAKLKESEPNRIQSLELLESFGAGTKSDEGYMFVPDGSGALIHLNNGRTQAQAMLISMYGDDNALDKPLKYTSYLPSRMPVFGIKKKDEALFAVIEEGDALAQIKADISGRLNSYNTVGSKFTILPSDTVNLATETTIKMPKAPYQGKLQVRYSFLYGDKADYSGMAAEYRNYLVKKYGLKRMTDEGDVPIYVELTGSIPMQKHFLGFPYEDLVPLSRISQAEQLVSRLNNQGIGNIRLSYKGWFNGGLNHDIATKVRLDSVIGNEDEWRGLSDRLRASGGQLYPDVALIDAYGGGFNPSQDAVQRLSRNIAAVFAYDAPTYNKDYTKPHYDLLSPSVLPTVVKDFIPHYQEWNPGGVSLRDLGNELDSDFRSTREVTREDAKRIVADQLRLLKEHAPSIMVNGGNAYALPYADQVLNIPETSNEFQLADESIPFFQMVLHGYVDYAGEPFNMADDQDVRTNVLKSLETGSNVYYSWVLQNASVLKNTAYEWMYAEDYENWLQEAIQTYEEVDGVLKQVKGQTITEHRKLADGVYQTTYENGKSIIVNYRDRPFQEGGASIGPRNYTITGG